MINGTNLKNATKNAISLLGILSIESIIKLEADLKEMIRVLDEQSTSLICEVEDVISIQSQMIDHNCLYGIEKSVENISLSTSNDTLTSVKDVLNNMEDRISELEGEIREKNIEKFNEVCRDTSLKNEFINELKKNNSKAMILFDGHDLRQSLLDTFVSQDSCIMENEKDNMISLTITYVDLATRKYNEYIEKLESLINVVEDTELLLTSCEVAKDLLFNYSRDSLLAKTPQELYEVVYNKIKEVL